MGCAPSSPAGAAAAAAADVPSPPLPVDWTAIAAVPGLADAASWMTPEQARLTRVLLDAGQAHLFAKWEAGHAGKKAAFYAQVRRVARLHETLVGAARGAPAPVAARGTRTTARRCGALTPHVEFRRVTSRNLVRIACCAATHNLCRSRRSRAATRAASRRTSTTPSSCSPSPPRGSTRSMA